MSKLGPNVEPAARVDSLPEPCRSPAPGFDAVELLPRAVDRSVAFVSGAAFDADAADVCTLLTLLDTHLAQRPYMAGERLTMADIPIACEMHRWWGLPLEHPEHPHLRRWYEGLRQSPAARGALDVPLS
ncbi:glutathione S-transferase C-terminal domain-containing protein [Sorangium sp. So ce1128]|uniref:GST C-terminal domain-containing protein n=1 Tax=Sorangium cellulosum TaxID=56 RepID=A0A3S7V008_SORCE|nr:hypothetical protein [Sorangium cellulosum]